MEHSEQTIKSVPQQSLNNQPSGSTENYIVERNRNYSQSQSRRDEPSVERTLNSSTELEKPNIPRTNIEMSSGNKMQIPGPLNQQPGYVQLVNHNIDPSQPGEAYQTNFPSELSFGYQTQILSSPNLNPYQYSNPLPYQYAVSPQHGSVNGVAPQQLIPAFNIENQRQILDPVISQPISQSDTNQTQMLSKPEVQEPIAANSEAILQVSGAVDLFTNSTAKPNLQTENQLSFTGDTVVKQHTKPNSGNQLAQCPPIPVSQFYYSPLTLPPAPVQYSNINQPTIPVQWSGPTGTQNIGPVNTSAYYPPPTVPLVQYITPMPFNNMNQYNAPLKDNGTARQLFLPSNEQTYYSYPHFAQNPCAPPLPVVDQFSGIPPQWPMQINPQQYRFMPELYNSTIQSHIVAQHCPVSPTQASQNVQSNRDQSELPSEISKSHFQTSMAESLQKENVQQSTNTASEEEETSNQEVTEVTGNIEYNHVQSTLSNPLNNNTSTTHVTYKTKTESSAASPAHINEEGLQSCSKSLQNVPIQQDSTHELSSSLDQPSRASNTSPTQTITLTEPESQPSDLNLFVNQDSQPRTYQSTSSTQNSSEPETSNHLSTTASNNAIDYILSNQYIAERVKRGPIKIVFKNIFGVDSFYRVHMAPQSQQAIGKSNPPEMQTVSPSTPKQWNLSAAEFYPSTRPSQEGSKLSQIVQPGQENSELSQIKMSSVTTTPKLNGEEFSTSITHPTQDSSKLLSDTAVLKQNAADTFQPSEEGSESTQAAQSVAKVPSGATISQPDNVNFDPAETQPNRGSFELPQTVQPKLNTPSEAAILEQNAAISQSETQPNQETFELPQTVQPKLNTPSETAILEQNAATSQSETQPNQETFELPQTVQPKLNTPSEAAILKQNATTSQSHQEGLGLPPMVQSVLNLLPTRSSQNKLTKQELMLFTKENAQPQPKNAEGTIPHHLSNILHNLFIQEPSVVVACEKNELYQSEVYSNMEYVVELYNIPSEFSKFDILNLFGDEQWYIVRCHPNHALVLTASKEEANRVCEFQHDVIKARSILYGSDIAISTFCSSELLKILNTFKQTTSENEKSTKKDNILVESDTEDLSEGNDSW